MHPPQEVCRVRDLGKTLNRKAGAQSPSVSTSLQRQRVDKWLWAARFFRTRALAVQAIERGRVRVAGQRIKPACEIAAGDLLKVQQGEALREVRVQQLGAQRGPAAVAQCMYQETEESVAARARELAARYLAPEPALALAHGRPTKRDRRALDASRRGDGGARWPAAPEE